MLAEKKKPDTAKPTLCHRHSLSSQQLGDGLDDRTMVGPFRRLELGVQLSRLGTNGQHLKRARTPTRNGHFNLVLEVGLGLEVFFQFLCPG